MAFRPPPPVSAGWRTSDWTDWLVAQRVVHSVRSDDPCCVSCSGSRGSDGLGNPYPTCWPCGHAYSSYLRRIVPISYSLSAGLTSLIAQAKDESPGRDWVRRPLASILHGFLQRHWDCLERTAGGSIDLVVPIPSHGSSRGGVDHLVQLNQTVVPPWRPKPWTFDVLAKQRPSTADDHRRAVVEDLFAINPWHDLAGKRVLLIDDLCTTGSTIASAAAALTAAGAERSIAVTIGRHTRTDDARAQDLLNLLPTRAWEPQTCAVHDALPWPFTSPSALY
jgi:predicted amidophosphoribosyltransferase